MAPQDNDKQDSQPLQAILFADSFTQTFRPPSLSTPKVLCPLNNVKMIDYTIEFLVTSGVQEIFIFCVHLANLVERYVSITMWSDKIKIQTITDKSCTNAGDALRELDKRGLVRSDPFIMVSGDVVTNVDLRGVLNEHKLRHKADNSAMMTMLFKEVGKNSPLRSVTDDLIVGVNVNTKQIVLFDDNYRNSSVNIPSSFFASHSKIKVRSDLLDCGIDICSPDVLARFSDEFDYRDIRKQFVHNSAAEEEDGLQNRIYSHILKPNEYAARVHDFRTYAAVSNDMIRRWCYPVVPDKLPSGYEAHVKYKYDKNYIYREMSGNSTVERSSVINDGCIIGANVKISEHCVIAESVIGNDCEIGAGTVISNSHLWSNCRIEGNVQITSALICDDCVVREGAVIPRGCVIGQGCIVGKGVVLPEFTRLTRQEKGDDDNEVDEDWGDDSDEEEDEDEDEDDSDVSLLDERSVDGDGDAIPPAPRSPIGKSGSIGHAANTDINVVGKDGLGRVWSPSTNYSGEEEYDDDDNDDSDSHNIFDLIEAQSIGFEARGVYEKRLEMQRRNIEDEFDEVSGEDGVQGDVENNSNGMEDDPFSMDALGGRASPQPNDIDSNYYMLNSNNSSMSMNMNMNIMDDMNSNMMIMGRQKGVDVVKELKGLCLEHDKSSSLQNLCIELNSFKFSQNATYRDCNHAVVLAVFELVCCSAEVGGMGDKLSLPKIIGLLKKEFEDWKELFVKLCPRAEDQRGIMSGVEDICGNKQDAVSLLLKNKGGFRFILQTLFDIEVCSEEALLSWAEERRKGEGSPDALELFGQKSTADFLEWLEEEEESDDDEDEDEEDE